MYKYFFKAFFDFVFALTAGLLLLPIAILITLLLMINNNGKPFFIQKRPGKNARIFSIIKFKTMNDKKDPEGYLLPDVQRLTGIGKFVRKTSLDEIPQLWNVVKGDMSLVGPRPLLVDYLPLYDEEQTKRHDVKPGITGWAQVNGRNTLSWKKKFEYDVWYTKNISFLLDVKIVWMTVNKVFRSEGISSGTTATMEKFEG